MKKIRKKSMLLTAANVIFFLLMGLFWYSSDQIKTDRLEIRVNYGEDHANAEGGTSQLFYAKGGEAFSEEQSLLCNINEGGMYVQFALPKLDLEHTDFRLDPFMNEDDFSIRSFEVLYRERLLLTLPEGEFVKYIKSTENCEFSVTEDGGFFEADNGDARLYLDAELNQRILQEYKESIAPKKQKLIVWAVILFLWLEGGMLLFFRHREHAPAAMTKRHLFAVVVADILLILGAGTVYGAEYLMSHFGNVSIEELLFQARMPLEGANVSSFQELFYELGALALIITCAVAGIDMLARRMGQKSWCAGWMASLGLAAGIYGIVIAGAHFDFVSYWKFTHEKTTLYEENYVDARDVAIKFPEKKRNLIYIYLESMEMTYASKDVGGAMDENYIPELTALAMENIDFSAEGCLNGAHSLSGTTFTTAAIVADTSGTPINTSLMSNETVNAWSYGEKSILPGVWTLGDVLHEEGYRQMFLIGSNGVFGGRSPYMKAHGDYQIKDYNSALAEGRIPEDYYVWWGYEDEKLIAYAKEELQKLAEGNEPFNFTMLTADTHFTDGYLCPQCGDAYSEQYSNVIACSSKMITEFVSWILEQDFYENTTIVIAGDHPTMDSGYIERRNAQNYDRRVYVTIINAADGCKEKERERGYSTFDLYPTTLAALGAQIEGDQLGLGVNLFSEKETLYEKYGKEYLDGELLKSSQYYEKHFMRE